MRICVALNAHTGCWALVLFYTLAEASANTHTHTLTHTLLQAGTLHTVQAPTTHKHNAHTHTLAGWHASFNTGTYNTQTQLTHIL